MFLDMTYYSNILAKNSPYYSLKIVRGYALNTECQDYAQDNDCLDFNTIDATQHEKNNHHLLQHQQQFY